LLLTTRHISINLITSSTAKMKSVVALSALAAAATAQRAGPVALVNPVQVALDGFSEDVNQDGFVDPIAPAVAPLGLGYGAALPLGGYGLGYGAGIWKRDAEPQWLAYGAGPLNLAIPHGAFGAVLHPNGAVAPPYTADQQLALAEKNKILAERGQLPALPVAAALIKRDADSEAEADPQLLLGGGILGAPALGLAAPAGLLATGIAPTYTLGGAVVAPAIAAPAVEAVEVAEAAPVEAVEVAAPAIAAPAITYAAPAIAAPAIAAPAIAAPALAAPALTYAAAPAVAHVAVPTVQHVAYTQHIPVSKTYTQTIDLGVQRRVISSPLIAGLAGAPVVAAAPVAAVAAEEAVVVEE